LLTIQEQRRDLRHLEESIRELNQLFVDMSALVDQSHTPMRNIQGTLDKTVTHVKGATHELAKTEQYVAKKRRRVALLMVAIVTVILLVFAVIGLVIAEKLGAFSGM